MNLTHELGYLLATAEPSSAALVIAAVVSAVAAVSAAVIAAFALSSSKHSARAAGLSVQVARENLAVDVSMRLRGEWRSAEMLTALRNVTSFRGHKDGRLDRSGIRKEYAERFKEDIDLLKQPDIVGSLDYHRRLLSGYFEALSALNSLQLLRKEAFLGLWSNSAVEVIRDILIPMEKAICDVRQIRGTRPSDLEHVAELIEGWLAIEKK